MDFEKLGAFYLGKEYDVGSGQLLDQLFMYDARDLTTHAVCVGMTGSGKTGLCIDLLEEAAIDRVPALILDPKGDITNLLLHFPNLLPDDFRPWINPDDARRKGQSLDQYAASQSELWRNGLAQWGQSPSRIQLLKDSAEFTIYTPGSEAGVPVSILQSFAPPAQSWNRDAEVLRERIEGMVSALLGLIGIEADPVRSREHILLSNLFEHFWREREDLDLRKLILSIQNPPLQQLGVFDVDTFFPQKDRFELAMGLNNIIASPAFTSWLKGQPLDVASFLATPEGRPRHSIFYLAHLNDAERIFFVTMLLNQVIGWMRAQPGTTSLRALVYMDEIFGFFPPVSNPPSKKPMLTLLKQARAFGVGLLLATQNPVDLDYKGLTNAGTWFIGRLQTERDKKRVLDGLQTASAGGGFDPGELSSLISKLGKRVFLAHNVHEEGPVTFQTRWAMNYLRGPMTRTQIEQLMAERDPDPALTSSAEARPTSSAGGPTAVSKTSTSGEDSSVEGYLDHPPAVPPGVRQVFLPVRRGLASSLLELEARQGRGVDKGEHHLVYRPALTASGRVHFVDHRRKVDVTREFTLLTEVPEGNLRSRWEEARVLSGSGDFLDDPEPNALFESLPKSLNEAAELKRAQKELADHLYRDSQLTLLHSPLLKEYSQPEETEREFRLRLTQKGREQRDDEVDEVNATYQKRIRRLLDQLRRAELALEKREATADARGRELLVSVGESVLGMFLGRRSTRTVSSSLSKYRMRSSARLATEEATEKVESLRREVETLEEELREQTGAISSRWDKALEDFEEVAITPRSKDVEVDFVALAWEPAWLIEVQEGNTHHTHTVAAG